MPVSSWSMKKGKQKLPFRCSKGPFKISGTDACDSLKDMDQSIRTCNNGHAHIFPNWRTIKRWLGMSPSQSKVIEKGCRVCTCIRISQSINSNFYNLVIFKKNMKDVSSCEHSSWVQSQCIKSCLSLYRHILKWC